MNEAWEKCSSADALASRLWTFEALELSPRQFHNLAHAVWRQSPNARTLWQLGGALHDYLRKYPQSLTIPPKLPWLLLRSRQADPRIIGLKLLKHCAVGDETFLKEVLRALRRYSDYEQCGGIHELSLYLKRRGNRRIHASAIVVEKVRRRLARLAATMPDETQRQFAAVVLEQLNLGTS